MKSKLLFVALPCVILFLAASCRKEKLKDIIAETRGERGSLPTESTCSFCRDHNPVGGGEGYANIVTSGTYNIYSEIGGMEKTPTELGIELAEVIADAVPNTVIFIEGDCEILVTSTLIIDKSLTIASDRGNGGSPGAHILCAETAYPLFDIQANTVRISGLRLEGNQDNSLGIRAHGFSRIQIDNNEFYEWMQAISIHQTDNEGIALGEHFYIINNNYIHHNHYSDFYDNTAHPLGYGIALGNAFLQVYANQFEFNRHDLAAVGWANSGFNMYCNIFGDAAANAEGNKHQNIDIHGAHGFTENYAGGFMHIHHNDFLYENPGGNIYPVGKPTVLMLIDNNKFKSPTIYYIDNAAIMQRPYLDPDSEQQNNPEIYGNIFAVNNTFDGSYLGWYTKENWDPASTDNFVRIPSTNDLLHANLNLIPGTATAEDFTNLWIQQAPHKLDYYLGDFNGDGRTDIFKSDGGRWFYLPLATNYANGWILLNDSQEPLGEIDILPGTDFYTYTPNLVFDNWNGDAITDVFNTTGTEWQVSYSGTTAWTTTATSGYTTSNTLFGKFNSVSFNNQIMDVFRTDAGIWYIAYDGISWIPVNASPLPLAMFKVGDFDGDGYDDIFRKTGPNWYYRSNAIGPWINLNWSNVPMNKLLIADFYSNSRSDVIGNLSGQWSISLQGTTTWYPLKTATLPISGLPFGDLD
jgi:hypothetical protein